MMLFVANEGYLDGIELSKIAGFESALLSYARSEFSDLMAEVDKTNGWNDEIEGKFKECVEKFKATQSW